MKKSSFVITFKEFVDYMLWDDYLLDRIEHARMVVKAIEVKRDIFDAFVFHICANWEILVETLLIDCLNWDTSRFKEFTGIEIPKNVTREICTAIVLGRGYFDFRSTDNLRQIANEMLVPQFNPFKEIPKSNGDKVDEFFKIRNYLAHYSDAARRSLKKVYRDNYGLKTFRAPGEFLLAKDRKTGLSRMTGYIKNFEDTARIMAKFLNVDMPDIS